MHTRDYLEKLRDGTLDEDEQAQLEIRWSPEVVEGFRLMTGGTMLAAAACALQPRAVDERRAASRPTGTPTGVGIHLGGGFHHACEDHGEGFCLFNDVAVAIRAAEADRRIGRAAVVDCDVHHGNGTAFIFTGDRSVFTFSIHQEHNYPVFKPLGIARHPPARLHRRRGLPAAAGGRAAAGLRAAARTSCSTWPAPTRSRTTSWAA